MIYTAPDAQDNSLVTRVRATKKRKKRNVTGMIGFRPLFAYSNQNIVTRARAHTSTTCGAYSQLRVLFAQSRPSPNYNNVYGHHPHRHVIYNFLHATIPNAHQNSAKCVITSNWLIFAQSFMAFVFSLACAMLKVLCLRASRVFTLLFLCVWYSKLANSLWFFSRFDMKIFVDVFLCRIEYLSSSSSKHTHTHSERRIYAKHTEKHVRTHTHPARVGLMAILQ